MIAAYEPAIVTTLRRYHHRGAPPSLLRRLAGGPRDWRLLNDWWGIDGVVRGLGSVQELASPLLGDQILTLSAGERRIALVQLADTFSEARHPFPTQESLARYFGVSRRQIQWDLERLRDEGRIARRLVGGADAL